MENKYFRDLYTNDITKSDGYCESISCVRYK